MKDHLLVQSQVSKNTKNHDGARLMNTFIKIDCEKKFSRPDSLTTHIKTHSTVRPFVCSYKGCGKAYYHSRSLKKHEKIHEIALSSSPNKLTMPPTYEQAMSINVLGQVPNANTTPIPFDANALFYQPQTPTSASTFTTPSIPVNFFSPHAQQQQAQQQQQQQFNSFVMDPMMNHSSPTIQPPNYMVPQ